MDSYDEAKQVTRKEKERAIGFNGGLGSVENNCKGARAKLIAKTSKARKVKVIEKQYIYKEYSRIFETSFGYVKIYSNFYADLPFTCKVCGFGRIIEVYAKTPLEAFKLARKEYENE